jgi:hypothetical protein
MLDMWEVISAPDQYKPGTFEQEMRKYLAERIPRGSES